MKAFKPNGTRWFSPTTVEVMDRWLADRELLGWFARTVELTELRAVEADALLYVARPVLMLDDRAAEQRTEEQQRQELATALAPELFVSQRGDPLDPPIGLPPSPLCQRCEHNLCPCCPTAWCDSLMPIDCEHCKSTGLSPYVDVISGEQLWCSFCDGDTELCCDGSCVVDPLDFEAWQAQLRAVGAFNGPLGPVTLQVGPFWPAAARLSDLRSRLETLGVWPAEEPSQC